MAKAPPKTTDIPIPEPPSRFSDPSSIQYGMTGLYNAAAAMAVLERQARSALIAQSGIASPTAVAALTLTAGAAYVQADFQTVINKVNEVIAKQAEIIAVLAALKSAASTNIVSLSPDPEA